jgi:NADPH2 dehydrogenase
MSHEEIGLWKESFFLAAARAVAAGFGLVEFHSAHGYGLNQWLSPITNRRTDEYGGSLFNRARLLFEIIEKVRQDYPQLLISARIPGQDFYEGGLTVEDMIQIALKLEQLGVDIINVSSGIGGWRRPRDRTSQGYLIPEAKKIQANISTPVIGVGGIQTGDFIDNLVFNNIVSLAAVGRAILSDPKAWGDHWISN